MNPDKLGNRESYFGHMTLNNFHPEIHAKDTPLQAHHADQKREADSAVRVLSEERHEEAEANKNHDVDILEHGIDAVKFDTAVEVGDLGIDEGIVLGKEAEEEDHEGLEGDEERHKVSMVVCGRGCHLQRYRV